MKSPCFTRRFSRFFDFLLITGVIFAAALTFHQPLLAGEDVRFSYPPGLTAADVEKAASGITDADVLWKMEKIAGEEFLGREYGTPHGRAAAEYLAAELKSYGYAETQAENTSFLQEIPREAYPEKGAGQNVLAVLPGSDPELAEKYIILCAHYDHLGFRDVPIPKETDTWTRRLKRAVLPTADAGTEKSQTRRVIYYGADDNASSVTILLEVARALKRLPVAPKRSILFLFADGEEKFILGSRYWAENPTIPLKNVELVMNFDLNGCMNKKSQLYIFGTRTGEHLEAWFLAGNAAGEKKPVKGEKNVANKKSDVETPLELVFPWSVMPRSDHAAFLPYEIPACMTATGITQTYHTPQDTVDSVNIPGIRRISQFFTRIVTQMACADENITVFRPQWHTEKCPVTDDAAGFFSDINKIW